MKQSLVDNSIVFQPTYSCNYAFCTCWQCKNSTICAVLNTRVGTLIVATIYLQLIQN